MPSLQNLNSLKRDSDVRLAKGVTTDTDEAESSQHRKTMGKISKKIRSNMTTSVAGLKPRKKEGLQETFNLTTTAAALIAASDRNAAAITDLENKTFES